MKRFLRLLPFALALTTLVSAGTSGCSTFASHEEYQSYRAVRTAEDERTRLVALAAYAENHPDGIWREEVREMRRAREDEVWASSSDTREGLEWYLRIYPDGQYVDQARPRLVALQTVSTRRDEEAERQRDLERQQREAAAEQRRTWVTRAMQFWVGNLLGIRQYGQPLGRVAQANQEFSNAFGAPPAPTCNPEFCIKHYGQVFHIPVPGATRIDRHIDVYMRLVLNRGRLQRAELLMPNKGFSRWYELENETVITDEDPEQRMMAINWALERLEPIIQQHAAGATPIDYVPEPIEPLQLHGEAEDTEAAPAAPGDTNTEEAPPTPQEQAQTPAETPGEQQAPSEFDQLLAEAAGTPEQTEATPPPAETAPPPVAEGPTLVLPIGLQSFRHRNLRVVVFAAGDEDYDEAFDGVFFEPASE